MAHIGYEKPIGSSAMDGETDTELVELEEKVQAALAKEHEATRAAAKAIEARTTAQKRLLRAKAEQARETLQQVLELERIELDSAIRIAAERVRSATGIVAVAGGEGRWPGWLETALADAREQAAPGELPAAVLVRPVSATGAHDDGVALILDMTGRLERPQSALSANDHARRVRARQGM